ncbi:MAG TPA: hypothetical protein VIM87_09810 [Chitinophaga sp.]|uniref:hypothetical protein n=1 Tax=Chitinophaga sp. TaxID=1869181 RepID=UPI002F95FDE1
MKAESKKLGSTAREKENGLGKGENWKQKARVMWLENDDKGKVKWKQKALK